ncbi:pentapeptide repeat-containing protein [Winogradskyella ouciana]|nr:pentapeptide repeat-containing protein [Winogradskyella ouciana]
MSEQLEIFTRQDTLLQKQVDNSKEQNDLIRNQNILFEKQNEITDLQKEASIEQNALVENQNSLIDTQNKNIELQSNLLDADRKSSLNILFNSLIDKIDEELTNQKDSKSKSLSQNTLNRAIALSHAFKPYNFLSNSKNEQTYLSPERGQLLLFLINSDLSKETLRIIFRKGNFNYSDLEGVTIENKILDIDLSFPSFNKAKLNNVIFKSTNLNYTTFILTEIQESLFHHNTLTNTNFENSKIHFSTFIGCRFNNVNFAHGSLVGCHFRRNTDPIPFEYIEDKTRGNRTFSTTGHNFIFSDEKYVELDVIDVKNKQGGRNYSYDDLYDNVNTCIYYKMNFENTNLSLVRFSDIIFEKSNFNNAIIAFTNLSHISFLNCKTSKVLINHFTLDSFFVNENEKNKAYKITNNNPKITFNFKKIVTHDLYRKITGYLKLKNGSYDFGFDGWPEDLNYSNDKRLKLITVKFI